MASYALLAQPVAFLVEWAVFWAESLAFLAPQFEIVVSLADSLVFLVFQAQPVAFWVQ